MLGLGGMAGNANYMHTRGEYLKVPKDDRGTSTRGCQLLSQDGTEQNGGHPAHRQSLPPNVSPSFCVDENPRSSSLKQGVR